MSLTGVGWRRRQEVVHSLDARHLAARRDHQPDRDTVCGHADRLQYVFLCACRVCAPHRRLPHLAWFFELSGGAVTDTKDSCVAPAIREASFTVAALHQWEIHIDDPRCRTSAETWVHDTLGPVSTGAPFTCVRLNPPARMCTTDAMLTAGLCSSSGEASRSRASRAASARRTGSGCVG